MLFAFFCFASIARCWRPSSACLSSAVRSFLTNSLTKRAPRQKFGPREHRLTELRSHVLAPATAVATLVLVLSMRFVECMPFSRLVIGENVRRLWEKRCDPIEYKEAHQRSRRHTQSLISSWNSYPINKMNSFAAVSFVYYPRSQARYSVESINRKQQF